jgi:hypothetical protein
MALEKGTTLAGYRIEGILGQGGMGVVYEATQLSLNRTVALKILAPHLSDDVLFRERFRREGEIQAGIDHAHIVTVHEAGETDHGFFIAMRLIRGPNLKNMIVARELDPARTLSILGPIAEALDTAHEAGLIHRDVKPQNILVAGRDQGFLADFGLTKAPGDESLTKTGQFVGTFDYISPEQIKGERATAKSDVYALAAVLYECFTGVVPYPKESDAATLYAHVSDAPPKVTEQRPELPEGLDEVIATGMAKDPAGRYASASELLRETNEGFSRRMRAAPVPPAPIKPSLETARVTAAGETVRAAEPSETSAAGAVRGSSEGARRPGGWALIGSAGAVLLVVIAVGFVVGRASGGSEGAAPRADNTDTAGALALSYPDAWRRATDPPAVPGLRLRNPIALSERGRPRRDGLTAGTTDATGPALLPPELLERLAAPPKRDDPVKLGALDVYRYQGLRPSGFNGRLTLYVAPTTEGVTTVACASTAGDAAAFLPDCENVAGGLQLVRGKAFALGADQSYLAKLGKAIGQLNADRQRDAAKLREATKQVDQANAARSLANGYRRARRSLRGLTVSPAVLDASESVLAALAKTELAYSRLAARAHDGSRAEYNAARDDVSAGEAALKRALAQVDVSSK